MTGFHNRLITLLFFTAAATMVFGALSPALAKGKKYTVQEGDNLWTVARKFDTHVHDIALINKLDRSKSLKPGTVIELPDSAKAPSPPPKAKTAGTTRVKGTLYTVREGDSAWLIARRHDMHTAELLRANGLDERKPLKLGQAIIIPRTGAVPTKAVARQPKPQKKVSAEVARRPRVKPAAVAVVIGRRAELYSRTTTRSEMLRIVGPGTRLAVIGKKNDWVKLQLATGEIAWIPARCATLQKLQEKPKQVAAVPKNKTIDSKKIVAAPVQPGTPVVAPVVAEAELSIEPERTAEVTASQESKFIRMLAEELGRNPQAADQIAGASALLLSQIPAPLDPGKAMTPEVKIPTPNAKYADQGLKYLNTRYRRGGLSSRGGMDCSGLIVRVLRDYGKDAPHNAAALFNTGHPIDRADLQPGDLVFFKNTYRRGVSHVGIYIGKGKFVHASTHGQRVRITSLSEAYYINHWAGARRVH